MTFDQILSLLLHIDTVLVKFDGQGYTGQSAQSQTKNVQFLCDRL